MKKLLSLTFLLLCTLNIFAQKDEFVGFYSGEVQGLKKLPWFMPSNKIYAEVHREGDSYRIRLQAAIFSRADNFFIQDKLKAENGKMSFKGEGDKFSISEGTITPQSIQAKGKCANSKISFNLNKYTPLQKTLGQKAPQGATVIFDGTNTSSFEHIEKTPCQWQIIDGAIISKPNSKNAKGKAINGNIYTKEAFGGSFKLHIEFLCPADSYHLSGQKKNNSGIYIGDYEVQVLDSFGVESLWEDCGAIYRQSPPKVNACLEAGTWQTYDIIFYPAFFECDELIQLPSITVYHNDIKVQDHTPIYTATAGNISNKNTYKHPSTPLKIMLQEHKNKVEFRNIWLLPLEK